MTADKSTPHFSTHDGGRARHASVGEPEQLDEITKKADELVDEARKTARVVARQSKRTVNKGLVAAEEAVREQPLLVVAGVAVLGLAIGALWKLPRKSNSWQQQALGYVEPYYRSAKRHF